MCFSSTPLLYYPAFLLITCTVMKICTEIPSHKVKREKRPFLYMYKTDVVDFYDGTKQVYLILFIWLKGNIKKSRHKNDYLMFFFLIFTTVSKLIKERKST